MLNTHDTNMSHYNNYEFWKKPLETDPAIFSYNQKTFRHCTD